MADNFILYPLIAVFIIYVVRKLQIRLQLSKAKHPSLRGHSKWSRRIAKRVPYFSYNEQNYFSSDGAPENIAKQRQSALLVLSNNKRQNGPETLNYCRALESGISDIQFTSHYRIPFPYRALLPKALTLGSICDETTGNKIKDLDGSWRYDLSGSYGVNVFGYDFYKDCIEEGALQVKKLGPVLGSYHPLIAENVELIKHISCLDEVSFHMSGTEAIMQAVRLARYHTGKSHLVRFCGAYHGWWDGVQPGVGNQRQGNDVYTLADLSEHALHVLATRNDIACVLINPMQAFHPNSDAGSDSTLIASDRTTNFERARYTRWLNRVQEVCNRRNIVFIVDEVFTGFRLGYRGAQGYFNIQADLVTYGKTLGGGLPVGVLAGQAHLMKRFKKEAPANVSFARGTFNSHPSVMGTMNVFLNRIQSPEIQNIYQTIEGIWDGRVEYFNLRLKQENLPVTISNMHTVLSILYTKPSRYNWMLQFYLRDVGLELSWLGSSRMIMSFDFTDEQFTEVVELFITAATQMNNDGWWWQSPLLTNKNIKRQFLFDMIRSVVPIMSNILPSPLIQPPFQVSEHIDPLMESELSQNELDTPMVNTTDKAKKTTKKVA